MKTTFLPLLLLFVVNIGCNKNDDLEIKNPLPETSFTYTIVDTGVEDFYNNTAIISAPNQNAPFYGQDATYTKNTSYYTDNGDQTITDNITGLMW